MKGSISSVSEKVELKREMRGERENFRRCNEHAGRLGPRGGRFEDGDILTQSFPKEVVRMVYSSGLNSGSRGELGSVQTETCSEGGELGLVLGGVGVVGRRRPSNSSYS